jgi:hypothetical protein
MTNQLKIVSFDAATGEQTERNLTLEELAELELAETQAREEKEAQAAAKASALAKLAALGLTEAEIAAL